MLKRIVLTGAAGRLGSYLREPLTKLCQELVSTDIKKDLGKLYDGERYIRADLGNFEEVKNAIKGAEIIVHFGAIADEAPFSEILSSNIIGAYNVWEAAHQHKARRVIFASSIHSVGMYPKTQRIGTDIPHRPDTYYGLAKCFAEDLASLYWDKRGLESVCMRILSCAMVNNVRALGSWLSYDDLIHLVTRAIDTPITGFSIVYGVSNNDRSPVDNGMAHFLGYNPKDNAEVFAEDIFCDAPNSDALDKGQMCHGGPFASVKLGHSGTASMNIIDDKKVV